MSFFNQLKRRNVIKATISYLVISFALIEASDILFPILSIDSSYIRILFIILAIGLPVWMVFAYIYEWTPTGFQATDKVEVEKSIHKTTGKRLNRVIIIALALAVTFLLVDKFYLSNKVEVFPENGSIAVFPFSVQGTENIQYLREGMVDLLATKLDAIPGLQASDPNIILSSLASDDKEILRNPQQAAEIAREIGASRLVLGNLTEVGNVLQIKLSKYDLEGRPIGSAIVEEGQLNTLYDKIDDIIQRLVSEELQEQGQEFASNAVLSTSSFEAMIPYLKGVQYARNGFFEEAAPLFQEAIAKDSTFVLAHYNLVRTKGWTDARNWNFMFEYYPILDSLTDNLTGKTREIVKAYMRFLYADVTVIEEYERLLKKYGESLEILDGLAESYFHFDIVVNMENSKKYFEKLVQIDPENKEYQLHLSDIAIITGEKDDLYQTIQNFSGDSAYFLQRRFHYQLFEDSVSDATLQDLAAEFVETNQHPWIISGELVEKGLKLRERMVNINPELLERFGHQIQKGYDIIQGKHKEVILSSGRMRSRNDFMALNMMSMEYLPVNPEKAKEELNHIRGILDKIYNPYLNDSLDVVLAYRSLYKGKIALLLNDQKAYEENLNYLEKMAAIELNGDYEHDSKLADFRYFHQALLGIHAYRNNKIEEGRAYFQKADTLGIKGDRIMYMYAKESTGRLFEAEALLASERYQEALDLFTRLFGVTIRVDFASGYQYGRYLYRIAQCHDGLGNTEQAISYYNRFASVYADSDESYQDWVRDANQRLTALVENPEALLEEPAEDL